MRRHTLIVLLTLIGALAVAQSGTQSGTSKSGATAKPAPPKPTAIIHTTAGDMTCTLFPDKAPIGVANFIGLATGTRDWKNPVSGATKHGVPLYDGTIFHRVIPEFMIQGGDPAGNGQGDPGYEFKNEVSSDLCSIVQGGLLTQIPVRTRTDRSSSSPKWLRPISTAITPFSASATRKLWNWSNKSLAWRVIRKTTNLFAL